MGGKVRGTLPKEAEVSFSAMSFEVAGVHSQREQDTTGARGSPQHPQAPAVPRAGRALPLPSSRGPAAGAQSGQTRRRHRPPHRELPARPERLPDTQSNARVSSLLLLYYSNKVFFNK